MDGDGTARATAPPPAASAAANPTRPAQEPDLRRRPLDPATSERVIRRALELHDADRHHAAERLSAADIEAVVAELGIPAAYVRRALQEVAVAGGSAYEPSAVERALAPREVRGARLVEGTPSEVRTALATWLRDDEALVHLGTGPDGDRWRKDRGLSASLRQGFGGTRGDGTLRGLPQITASVEDAGEGRSMVALRADTTPVTATGVGLGVAGVVGGVAAGVGAAVAFGPYEPIGPDWLQFLTAAAPVSGLGIGAGVVTARGWARKVRRAVAAALDGVHLTVEEQRTQGSAPRRRSGTDDMVDRAKRWLGLGD